MPFIVFEGLDRAGKSSQVQRLSEHLRSQGKTVETFCFPDRTAPWTGETLNLYLQSRAETITPELAHLLFAANRREVMPAIEDALASGGPDYYVICDRYWYSGAAYSHAKGVDLELCLGADAGLRRPDIVLHLEGSPQVLAQRAEYGQERHDNVEFQQKVRLGYDAIYADLALRAQATGKPNIRLVRIDAESAADVIASAIRRIVETLE